MQAIILAAGMGKRLGEYTKNNTKCMVPVNGTPLIDRVLKQLSVLSLNRVVIVVGYEGKKLMEYLGNEKDGLKIEYVNNPVYDKTNNIYSLALAKDKMVEDDTTGAYGSTVKLVTVDIIVRILRQSWDGEPMSQESQSALGYNWSGTYAIPGGGIAAAIMRNDLKRLGLKQQRIRGIELYGPDQGDYSHFTG